MHIVLSIFILLCPVLLSACKGSLPVGGAARDELRGSSEVILHQDLVIPAGATRVFLQFGQVIAKTDLAIYQPHCNFEQRSVSDGKARIASGRFAIVGIREGEDFIVQGARQMYAALQRANDDYGMTQVNRYLHFNLLAAGQPEVMRLTCHGGFDFTGRAELPEPGDIHRSLGDVASLLLPDD